jgi:hypothetical protein
LRAHYGAVSAIVFYGSCLRENSADGLLDFYVLVDAYRPALGTLSALAAWLFPPNVYYHEIDAGRTLRAKVAVMRRDQFLRGVSARTFSSTLSARFAQPAAIVFARDDTVRTDLIGGFCAAVTTTLRRTLPLLPEKVGARELWRRALALSFSAELRPESAQRRDALVGDALARYEAAAMAVLGEPVGGLFRNPMAGTRSAHRAWALRRIQGKILNALRLIKAAFTFRGGLDYAAWKIRRHAGVEIALTARDRARPLTAGVRLFFVALRRGGVR